MVIRGPSGSGKSTVIRCIDRVEEHREGRIVVGGRSRAGSRRTGAGGYAVSSRAEPAPSFSITHFWKLWTLASQVGENSTSSATAEPRASC